jgi:hypothetical protein
VHQTRGLPPTGYIEHSDEVRGEAKWHDERHTRRDLPQDPHHGLPVAMTSSSSIPELS